MKHLKSIFLAVVFALVMCACASPPKPQPYALALFAFSDGQVVAAQISPAGDARATCEAVGKGAQKRAAAEGVSLGYTCLPVPKGPVVKPQTPAPGETGQVQI